MSRPVHPDDVPARSNGEMDTAVALARPATVVLAGGSAKPDDLELIKRCLAGDADQYRPLVERYQRIAFSVATRLLGSRADGEDVVQQAFVDAFRALSRFDGSGRPDAFRIWLLRIVINRAKDVLKSKKRTEIPLDGEIESAEAVFAHVPGDPEVMTARDELRTHLASALGALAPKYRECLILKDVEDLSYEEIRAILHLPITTLKIRVIRARHFLRETLERGERPRKP